ncbi:MAG: Mur ligase family protein [Myxococcales bacterium]|nr:Mur ligase family protein [Myxococcales bacterium]
MGVCGTGMGAFAGLLKQAGHRVTGSDGAFYPPMGDALKRWGIDCRPGYSPENLEPRPDLVVVGNVCRPDNPEARAAIDKGLEYTSFPGALSRMFLQQRVPFVVTGTHGKTTTSAMLAFLLDRTGKAPGFLVGGIAGDFTESFRAGAEGGPFVVEGDEYDSAFFEKSPKFWQYRPQIACIHAIEHDHIDIYPDMGSYRDAFARFVELIPPDGLLAINAADAEVRSVAARARCRVLGFALAGEDTGEATPALIARLGEPDEGGQPFELVEDGEVHARTRCPLSGGHNVKNALAALAMAAHGAGVPLASLAEALPAFAGVRRRQELRGTAGGVRVYDDFAHHPTAVAETLPSLRARHPGGRLIAIFEPRSATASRNLHQGRYAEAFAAADLALLAPVGRPGIPAAEKLDVGAIAAAIRAAGGSAETPPDVEAIVARVVEYARAGDTVVVMSNGAFDAIHDKLLEDLPR